MSAPSPIPYTAETALLLIDNQNGFLHKTYWGTSRSNPSYESNLTALISVFRSASSAEGKPHIIHIQHLSTSMGSPLSPPYIGDADSGLSGLKGIDFLDFAQPEEGEMVITKGVNSAFIGTQLEKVLREKGIRTLVIAGLTTDHCVSTTTRMAANLGVVDRDEAAGKGRIILVPDACATFAKGAFSAATVHAVNVASLEHEFAEVQTTAEVVDALHSWRAR